MASSSLLISRSTLVAAGTNIINTNNNNSVGAAAVVYKTKSKSVCRGTPSLISRQHYKSRVGLLESVKQGHHRVTRASSSEAESTMTTTTTTTTIEKAGVKIVRNPPESKLTDLGVRSWPKWGCPASKFPWTYSAKEICYLLKGKVKVYPDGSNEVIEIGAGDLVEFPKGMSCKWDVSEEVDKYYNFE